MLSCSFSTGKYFGQAVPTTCLTKRLTKHCYLFASRTAHFLHQTILGQAVPTTCLTQRLTKRCYLFVCRTAAFLLETLLGLTVPTTCLKNATN